MDLLLCFRSLFYFMTITFLATFLLAVFFLVASFMCSQLILLIALPLQLVTTVVL